MNDRDTEPRGTSYPSDRRGCQSLLDASSFSSSVFRAESLTSGSCEEESLFSVYLSAEGFPATTLAIPCILRCESSSSFLGNVFLSAAFLSIAPSSMPLPNRICVLSWYITLFCRCHAAEARMLYINIKKSTDKLT